MRTSGLGTAASWTKCKLQQDWMIQAFGASHAGFAWHAQRESNPCLRRERAKPSSITVRNAVLC